MSLPTNLIKPFTMIAGTDALASHVNSDFDYVIDAQNATNDYVNKMPSDDNPLMDGAQSPGTSAFVSRKDHRHPPDTTKLDVTTAAATYAPLVSPALSGNPTAPTPPAGDNDTSLATTAFVQTAINNLIDAAPGTLDTLNEIAAALGDDPNFAATMTQELALKAPLASPALTGNPTAPTQAADNSSTRLATTAFVIGQAGATDPVQDDTTAAVGSSLKYARADHRHPINPVIAQSVETCTTKASEASASASEASGYATTAVNAKNAAEAALDSFDDRYLGSKAADPATDNDGNALLTGALYFNTVSNEMRVYSGSAWVAAYIPSSSYATLTGEQTLTNKTIAYALNTLTGVQPTLVSGTNIKTINSTSLLGSGDITVGASLVRSARSSNTILGADDKGKLIDITSGTFTQTFTAAATLGDGWYCYIRNSGTGDITLDPNASETIDGLTSYIMYPGEVRLMQCDGTAFYTVVLSSFYKVFTASGDFTKPPGYTAFEGFLWAGGGAGRRGAAGTNRYGGMGGGCCPISINSALLSVTESVIIGSGGASASADSTNGGIGGNSTFSIFLAQGGYGGSDVRRSVGTSGAFYAGTTASHVLASTSSNAGSPGTAFYGGAESTSSTVFGGAGGRSINTSNVLYDASSSIYGGSGGETDTAGNSPQPGVAPGGGGGASTNGTASGAGARGECRIWGII